MKEERKKEEEESRNQNSPNSFGELKKLITSAHELLEPISIKKIFEIDFFEANGIIFLVSQIAHFYFCEK